MDNLCKQPLVSIIIPLYNVEQFLRCCLDSVVFQTYENLEIILMDDGSTDESGKICDEYANRDNRIKVFHQKNGGQALARNNALRYVHGDFIIYIDSDDIITDNHVEHLVKLRNRYGADIVQCEMVKFVKENRIPLLQKKDRKQKEKCEEVMETSEALRQFFYQKKFTASPWGKLIKRELMNNLEFPVGIGYEDLAVIYKVIGAAKKTVYSTKVCYYYRQHHNSTMHMKFSDKKIDRIRIAEQFLDYMKLKYPENHMAVYTRYDLAQMQLLMELPFDRKYKNVKEIAYNNLKRTRKIVLHDKEAPKKIKMMVRASYFGPTLLMLLGKGYNAIIN